LCNLKEAYLSLKGTEDAMLFKVCKVMMKSVLAGASGMHAVCVCTIHQNVKFMISGAKLYDLTEKK
jgi:hypothetical protein